MSRKKHWARQACACVLFGALAGCAPGSKLPWLDNPSPGPYRLGVGDRVRVITVGAEQLQSDFRVGADGTIAVPLLGNVPASGLTTTELAAEITADLTNRRLYRNPSVVAEIEDYRPIDVLGEVQRPGEYPYRPGMTLLGAVSVAGGFTYRAVTSYASVVRSEGLDKTVEGRVGRGGIVEPGDVITIYERHF